MEEVIYSMGVPPSHPHNVRLLLEDLEEQATVGGEEGGEYE